MTEWKDPEIVALRERMAAMRAAAASAPPTSFPERRKAMEAMRADRPLPDGSRYDAATLAGRMAERHTPGALQTEGLILYFHGGGYCIGSPISHRALAAGLAAEAGTRAVAFDYRLAPEHPFPAAVDDGLAAYRALLDEGADPKRIVIAGDSAGGGLTLATTLAAREAGLPMPAGLFVISPWVNLVNEGHSYAAKAKTDPILSKVGLDSFAGFYLAGGDASHPFASPAAADLKGLPPILIHVGSEEVLLSDAVALAQGFGVAGVEATLEIWPEMIHVWHMMPDLAAGRRAVARAGAWIRERLA